MLKEIATLEVAVGAVLALAFVVYYAATARWYESAIGRLIMGLMSVIVASLALSVFKRFHGPWEGIEWTAVVLYLLIDGLILGMLWQVVKVQRAKK